MKVRRACCEPWAALSPLVEGCRVVRGDGLLEPGAGLVELLLADIGENFTPLPERERFFEALATGFEFGEDLA